MSVSVVWRAQAEMIREGATRKSRQAKGHAFHPTLGGCLPGIDWLHLSSLELGGWRRSGSPSSLSDMADFSTEGVGRDVTGARSRLVISHPQERHLG